MEVQKNQEKIALPIGLALIIWDELEKKYGIEKHLLLSIKEIIL